jgi:hypothetical protein
VVKRLQPQQLFGDTTAFWSIHWNHTHRNQSWNIIQPFNPDSRTHNTLFIPSVSRRSPACSNFLTAPNQFYFPLTRLTIRQYFVVGCVELSVLINPRRVFYRRRRSPKLLSHQSVQIGNLGIDSVFNHQFNKIIPHKFNVFRFTSYFIFFIFFNLTLYIKPLCDSSS